MKPYKGKLPSGLESDIKRYFDDVQHSSGEPQAVDFDQDGVYDRIHSSIEKGSSSKRIRRNMYYAACIAALLVLVPAAFYFYPRFPASTQYVHILQREALPGSVTKIELSDGTQVWLNAGSKLRFPKSFAKGNREVTLEGEAYFDVAHDKSRPFLIHSGGMITKVLGTSFNISSYKESEKFRLTVLTGKVAVYRDEAPEGGGSGQVALLTANQELIYSKTQRQSSRQGKVAKPADAVAWKEGKLIFKDEELKEVIQRLERHFAVSISIDDIQNCPVTVNFDNEPLDRVLRVLSQVVNGKIEYRNGRYELTDVHCQ
jgi:ferric-dicitrate binding protein FerR (iron transport regulator)